MGDDCSKEITTSVRGGLTSVSWTFRAKTHTVSYYQVYYYSAGSGIIHYNTTPNSYITLSVHPITSYFLKVSAVSSVQ